MESHIWRSVAEMPARAGWACYVERLHSADGRCDDQSDTGLHNLNPVVVYTRYVAVRGPACLRMTSAVRTIGRVSLTVPVVTIYVEARSCQPPSAVYREHRGLRGLL